MTKVLLGATFVNVPVTVEVVPLPPAVMTKFCALTKVPTMLLPVTRSPEGGAIIPDML